MPSKYENKKNRVTGVEMKLMFRFAPKPRRLWCCYLIGHVMCLYTVL